ncbi:MAG: DUF952 domain-containing protein [Pyrinomonadaceae bacterium]
MPETWVDIRGKTFYETESLETEGFIHCSFADQLEGVLQRYYADAKEVAILTIDANKLTSPLVSELSTNNEPYPHIYGPINTDAIVKAETRPVGSVPVQDL